MAGESRHNKNLFGVMVFGTATAFGALGAIAMSMRDFFHGDATFSFSYKTIIGFVIGFVIGWLFWRVVRTKTER